VQVALQMRKQQRAVRVGDHIPYVICVGEAESIAERAFHPDDVKASGGTKEIDYRWYLAQQIHPPIARLCGPIEGTDPVLIAECLGLDGRKFATRTYTNTNDEQVRACVREREREPATKKRPCTRY
jgi:DNA polymerase alpha subunit A